MSDALRIRLFGGFALEGPASRPIALSLRKGEALLAYLGVSLGEMMPRERLAGLLWGDSEQHRARQSLRQVLFALSRELANAEAPGLRMGNQLVGLDPETVWVDAVEFERLVGSGQPEELIQAAALYRGDLLAGHHVESEDFEAWLAGERTRFRHLAMKALLDLLGHQEASGDDDAAIETANQALRVDPCREDIHRRLMGLYMAQGMRSSALSQYRVCCEVLERELDVPPDEETEALYRRILEQGPCRPAPGPQGEPDAAAADGARGQIGNLAEPTARLGEAARRLLQAACVGGPRSDYRVLAGAVGLGQTEALAAVEELVGAGICTLRNELLSVADPQTLVAVDDDILPPRRRSLHAALAAAIERVHGAELEPHYDRLAAHLREVDRDAEALAYALAAGSFAMDRGELNAARDRFQDALQATGKLDGDAAVDIEVEARLGLAAVAEAVRDRRSASELLRGLEDKLDRVADIGRRAAALHVLARYRVLHGDQGAAWVSARRALALGERAGGGVPWPAPDYLFARAHLVLDAAGRGVQALERLARRARRLERLGQDAELGAALAVLYAARGRMEEAHAESRRGLGVAEALGDERSVTACLQVAGMVETWRGDGEAALIHLDKAAGIAESRGDLLRLYVLGGHRGQASLAAGRVEDARTDLRRAVEAGSRLCDRSFLPFFTAWLAEAALEAGDEEEALHAGREAFRMAAESNQPWPRSVALRALARVLAQSASRDLAGAAKAIRSALEAQEGLGLQVERARSLIVNARLLRASGDVRRASDVYGEAGDLFQSMGMEDDFRKARTMAEALVPTGVKGRTARAARKA